RDELGDLAAVPRAHELHAGRARGEQSGRAVRHALRRGAGRVRLERQVAREAVHPRLEVLARLDEARVVEGQRVGGLLQRLGRACLDGELVPPVRGGPAVRRTDADGRDAGGGDLVDVRVELAERRRVLADAGLIEDVLDVPDALDAGPDRDAVLLAGHVPSGARANLALDVLGEAAGVSEVA